MADIPLTINQFIDNFPFTYSLRDGDELKISHNFSSAYAISAVNIYADDDGQRGQLYGTWTPATGTLEVNNANGDLIYEIKQDPKNAAGVTIEDKESPPGDEVYHFTVTVTHAGVSHTSDPEMINRGGNR